MIVNEKNIFMKNIYLINSEEINAIYKQSVNILEKYP